ncbi:hypothetical protein B1813_22625 [Saccharomonospora piscinae]|uniref:Sulfotransferase family protein n=1 Tax=Saccharomonospora piscinae TaxID=687388 RepID=A0A1V8ZXM1_SACPI|nr:sulfotransferase [Saccharomonospora piscinae]OQO89697.1 hypothetical protein B1813_22625 [Saccharomonospora piscinae]TLW91376.1 sulfotransferase [Saccharomonospora piscinae]
MSRERSSASSHEGAFVVGSGRCGSTVLSDLLAMHPETLSLQEFFITQFPDGMRLDAEPTDRFWSILTRPNRSLSVLSRIGRLPPEYRYPEKTGEGPEWAEFPAILSNTLPSLSDEPEALFRRIEDLVGTFPTQPLPDHYRTLFAELTDMFGKSMWIERSGASSMYVQSLLAMFPRAPFVYLTRDSVDVAISMSRHPVFQLSEIGVEFLQNCGFDPFATGAEYDPKTIPERLHPLLPENLTAETLDARSRSPETLTRLTYMVASMQYETTSSLLATPPERLMRLRYEDLVADPAKELERLGRFLGLSGLDDWLGRTVPEIRRPPRRDTIDPALKQRLTKIAGLIANE